MVVHEPGPWFDDVLSSLAAQEYANLRFLFLVAVAHACPQDAPLVRWPRGHSWPLVAAAAHGWDGARDDDLADETADDPGARREPLARALVALRAPVGLGNIMQGSSGATRHKKRSGEVPWVVQHQ